MSVKDTNARLRDLAKAAFPGYVVNKQSALREGMSNMPRFVIEFLLAAGSKKNSKLTIDQVQERMSRGMVDATNFKKFVSDLMHNSHGELICNLSLDPRPEKDTHVVCIQQLNKTPVYVDKETCQALANLHPALLTSSVWGVAQLSYEKSSTGRNFIALISFEPFQLTNPNMKLYKNARSQFTTLEWIDFLITSMGYNPHALEKKDPKTSLRRKILMLCRLLPLAVKNYHLVELGPKGTGKSYVLRNLSPKVYLIPGGRVSTSQLFYSLAKGNSRPGLFGTYQVAVFDEIGATKCGDIGMVAAMKDYLESGCINRGGAATTGDCSAVFAGNIDIAPDGQSPLGHYRSWFDVFPKEMKDDDALVDRMSGFIPGWEFPKVSGSGFATGLGLLADYFGEVLSNLRNNSDFEKYVREHLSLTAKMDDSTTIEPTHRDERSIRKTASGLLKIIYPDMNFSGEELQTVLGVAIELRQLIHNNLTKMAPEHAQKTLEFTWKE